MNKQKHKIKDKKIRVSALIAFITLILYAIFNGFVGFYFKSIINIALFVYYIIFCIIVGIIASRFYKRAHMNVIKLYFWSNIALLVIDTSLIVPLTLILFKKSIVTLPIWVCIVFGLYTIYKVINAIIGYRIHKYNNNLLFTELKTIKLIDACLSILSLANILILTFAKQELSNAVAWSFFGCGILLIVGIIVLTSISFWRGFQLINKDMHFKHKID